MMLTGHVLSLNEVLKNFDAVTANDVRRVAQKYLDPEYLRISAISPNTINGELNNILNKYS
jgi:predicted Zn-dependent peptidase